MSSTKKHAATASGLGLGLSRSLESDPPKPPPEVHEVKTCTLAELGPSMPFGVIGHDEQLHKHLECRRWRGKEEREVARIRREGTRKGNTVSAMLAYMYTRVGPHDFGAKEPEKCQALLGPMLRGDVMYMYLWLRRQCIGDEMGMNLTCLHCGFQVPWRGQLDTVEVKTANNLQALLWDYALQDPFLLRGGEAKTLHMGPSHWGVFEQAARKAVTDADAGIGAMELIQDAVRGVEDKPSVALTSGELDEMSKRDIEALSTEIDEREIGPDLSVKETCPRCFCQFTTSIDWGYASFFSMPSRHSRRSNS